jgi:hypothetical protein
MVRTAATRLRGALGLGVMGSALGMVATILRVTLASFFEYGLWPLPIEVSMAASAGALGGFVFGLGFGASLAVLSERGGLQELSIRRVALLGLAGGIAVPVMLSLVISGPDVFLAGWRMVLSASLTWGGFGGVMAPSAVIAAKRAERVELSGGAPAHRLGSGSWT